MASHILCDFLSDVLPAMQKVMIKGLAKDEKTLKELGVTPGSKVMVVGSKLDDVVNVNNPKTEVCRIDCTYLIFDVL